MIHGLIESSFITLPLTILLIIFMPKKKKSTWGGKRVSTKPKKEATVVKRIPVSKVEEVNKLIGK